VRGSDWEMGYHYEHSKNLGATDGQGVASRRTAPSGVMQPLRDPVRQTFIDRYIIESECPIRRAL
jgi:hypothetical protein